jgi:transcription initiation factor TFIID subunit 1, fungi type
MPTTGAAGAGSATSPPATSPPGGGSGGLFPANAMMSHGPSPLAMSPPVTAMGDDEMDDDDDDDDVPATPSAGAPKLKLTLKR